MAGYMDEFPKHIVSAADGVCSGGFFSSMGSQQRWKIAAALVAERDRCIEIAKAAGVDPETIARMQGQYGAPDPNS